MEGGERESGEERERVRETERERERERERVGERERCGVEYLKSKKRVSSCSSYVVHFQLVCVVECLK